MGRALTLVVAGSPLIHHAPFQGQIPVPWSLSTGRRSRTSNSPPPFLPAGQYGIASGVLKTSTHMGAAVAVAVFATTIDAVGSYPPGDGSAYAIAYLSAAALTVSGAAATGLLIRGSRSRHRPGLDRGPAQ